MTGQLWRGTLWLSLLMEAIMYLTKTQFEKWKQDKFIENYGPRAVWVCENKKFVAEETTVYLQNFETRKIQKESVIRIKEVIDA